VRVDPDHELLIEVERVVQIDGPAALEPAALLAEWFRTSRLEILQFARRSPVMKIRLLAALVLLLSPCIQAQTGRVVSGSTTGPGVSGGSISVGAGKIIYHRELGKWWQSSDIAKKLQLSDGQISQLDQTFYDHKVKLIDFTADMEKQDLKLQSLLDADVPNEGQIESQVDQVLSARGKLEREFTLMNLDLRKVLS